MSNRMLKEGRMQIQRVVCAVMVLSFMAAGRNASGQAFTGDARKVAMGGEGASANIALGMVAPAQQYAVIPIPIGLIQVLGNLKEFNPSDDAFDPVRAIESASNPLHYTFGRNSDSTGDPKQRFIRDLVNGELNRDLSTYRGFRLPETLSAEGLASGTFGGTIKFAKQDNGAFHGIYIGAGPYFSFNSGLGVDPRLTEILGSETQVYYPNATFAVTDGDGSAIQLAMSIVFGYRARFPFPGGSSAGDETNRDGIYLAGNYRYLKGFKYLQPDITVRFDTDPQGLVRINPATTPLVINDLEGSSGSGRAVDIGVQIVRDRFEGGVGFNGIGNKIDWTELALKRFTLTSLTQGSEFVEEELPPPFTDLTVKLPVVTSANFGFDAAGFAVMTSATHGFNGNSFHGGVERRFGMFAVRGGGRYSRDRWDPTYGFGFGRRVAIDVGFFGTHANLEDKRQTSMAVSLRINPRD
jgi:hypothetical protein